MTPKGSQSEKMTIVNMVVTVMNRQHEEICLRAMETGRHKLPCKSGSPRQHEEICPRAMERLAQATQAV